MEPSADSASFGNGLFETMSQPVDRATQEAQNSAESVRAQDSNQSPDQSPDQPPDQPANQPAVEQAADPPKSPLQQLQEAADPRSVAGGFLGLITGEAIGGTIGGVLGGAVLGPAGVLAGAGIGAFTGSMIGQKVGADTIADLVKIQEMPLDQAGNALANADTRLEQIGQFLNQRIGERTGEIVGIAAGSTFGMVIAGPVGGAIGATIGSTFGGQIGEDWTASKQNDQPLTSEQWLQKLGTNTIGEATTSVVGAAVGTAFLGVPGKRLGERVGTILGKRIEWHPLVLEVFPMLTPPADSSASVAPPSSAYTIVHRTTGYIRFRILQLSVKPAWAESLQKSAESWTGVIEVRLNLAARSLAIRHDPVQLSQEAIEQKIKSYVESVATPTTPDPATPEVGVSIAKDHGLNKIR